MKTGSPAPAPLLLLLSLTCLSAIEVREEVPDWPPSRSTSATVGDLHREYHNIFRHGNRNAASHLWATFLLERAHQMTWERLEYFFSGFCAVSGSPVRPGDYQRYELQLPSVTGGALRGFMYYCCWPCVCDTNDWIKVDTLSVRTADASTPRSVHVAVIGNPCARAAALKEPFIDAFGRGETTLELQAPEVRCSADGVLEGATLSDHGHVVIQIFPLIGDGHVPDSPDPLRSLPDGESPTPGRMRRDPVSGLHYQHEGEYGPQCGEREANGFNSGMGEIFRRVAQISPILVPAQHATLDAPAEVLEDARPTSSRHPGRQRRSSKRRATTVTVDGAPDP